jgi:uncharacterized protein YjbI with pentapeptide repeats
LVAGCLYFYEIAGLVSKEMGNKKRVDELPIFDATGAVVHRARVENPSMGLRGADLSGLVAPLGQLQSLDLSDAKMYWASLGDADLSFANLSGADLRGATLDRARCRSTSFRGANLGRDNLNGRTSLKGTDLSTADLSDAILTDAVFDDNTKFPKGFSPARMGMIHIDDLPRGDPGRI